MLIDEYFAIHVPVIVAVDNSKQGKENANGSANLRLQQVTCYFTLLSPLK